MPKESQLIRQLTAMGLYYYSIGLPSVKTILWHYRPHCSEEPTVQTQVSIDYLPACCHGMAGLVYRPDRKAGRLVGRSFSTGPLLSLSSLEALHSVPKCLVFTIQIGNTTNSAGLNIGMLGI